MSIKIKISSREIITFAIHCRVNIFPSMTWRINLPLSGEVKPGCHVISHSSDEYASTMPTENIWRKENVYHTCIKLIFVVTENHSWPKSAMSLYY